MGSLKAVGAQAAVVHMANNIRKERRKARAIGRDDPHVLLALARQRDADEAQERRRRLLFSEGRKRTLTAVAVNDELKAANALLKNRKLGINHAENMLETKHAIKTYSLEDLGHGQRRVGGAVARKRRL